MKNILFFFFFLSLNFFGFSQDFSNKGKDFWVGYGTHCQMYDNNGNNADNGGSQEMVLYFTSDVSARVTITIPSSGWTRSYSLSANTVVESEAIPKTGGNDVRLNKEGKFNKKGIHITSDNPIVAYAHIYNGNISGATLLFPTNTLGKEYYSLNYKQSSNQPYSYPFCFAIATEDSTILEITPSANTLTHPGGVTFRDTLMQGDVYNLLGQISGSDQSYTGVDLTGTRINSVSNSTGGCKRIAVFSGTGKLNIKCSSTDQNSADNTIQQVFPSNAWGQKYYTIPTANMPNNYFRVLVKSPGTVVKFNGSIQTNLINNSFYDIPLSNVPSLIEADQPVLVAQFITTRNQCGNNFLGTAGDPEMIYLSPIEQTIDKITLNSTSHYAIIQHWINVLIKSNAVSSFRLDGASKASSFNPHPSDASYSYAQLSVSSGQHSLVADSGFNAIAYGYGFAESYGYNAGTNVKDLYQFISTINQYAIVPEPSACSASPFFFSITLPYQPVSLYWNFHGHQTNISVATPVADTTYLVKGRRVWRYTLTQSSTYFIGTYPVTVTTDNPTPEGCSGQQDIDFDLKVYNPPVAKFTTQNNGCVTDSVRFTDISNLNGTAAYKWYWDFGDKTLNNKNNPVHKYTLPGTYNVRYQIITNVGCLSDTITKPITVTLVPLAKFNISVPECVGKAITFTDASKAFVPGNLAKWYWNYGDGKSDTVITNANRIHTYSSANSYSANLKVETNSGCQSLVYTFPVLVHTTPKVNFSLPQVCLPSGLAQFNDLSTIADGSEASFKYLWSFGDIASGTANSSRLKDPIHYYTKTGPFSINLQVTSKDGCVDDSTKILSTIYPAAKADFSVNPKTCLKDSTSFTDESNGNGNAITTWYWDFGDGQFSSQKSPKHLYLSPGSYNVKLYTKTNKNCLSDTVIKKVIINPLPIADFKYSSPGCQGKSVTISNTSLAKAGNIILWKWNLGDGTTFNLSSGSPFDHTYVESKIYNVSLSVETDKGCKSSVLVKPVEIYPLPVANLILPEVCLNDAFAQFFDSSYISDDTDSSFTYKWNFNDPSSPATNTSALKNPKHKYNSVGNYNVALSVISKYGCTTSLTKPFTVNGSIPKADFEVQDPGNLCSNLNVQIKNTSTVNFGSITKVEIFWNNKNSPSSFDTDDFPAPDKIYNHQYANFQNPLTKTFQIKFRSFSGGSCVNEIIKTVTVNATPLVSFSSVPKICYTATPLQITQASETGGVPGSGVFTGPGISEPGIFNANAAGVGSHTIRYTFTSNKGCIDFKEQTIEVPAPPVANFGYSKPACETKDISFFDSSKNSSGNIIKWKWNFDDASTIVTRNSGESFTHTFSLANTYNVSLIITTSDGCSSEAVVKPVKINPQPVVDFTLPKVCLPDANALFNNLSTISDGSSSSFKYVWNFDDPNSVASNTSSQKNPTHIYKALGPYSVSLTVTSNAGCIASLSKEFNDIHPQPVAKFSSNVSQVCEKSIITFTENSSGVDTTLKAWQWNFGDGNTSLERGPITHTFNNPGNFNVKLVVTNNNDCISDPYNLAVLINPFPSVDAGPDRVVLEGGTITLEPNVNGTNLKYLWSPNQYLNSITVKNPVATGVSDITYLLTVTGTGNCSASDQVMVKILKSLRIPNTFTPNNDGINDKWIIQYLDTYPDNRVQVFNRYGQLVFESKGYGEPWDGNMKGNPVPIGTYYYVIEPGSGRKPVTGYVTILK